MQAPDSNTIGADLRRLDKWLERALVDIRNVQAMARRADLSRRLDSAESALQLCLERVRDYTEVQPQDSSSTEDTNNNDEATTRR